MSANFKPQRTAAASRGFLAIARLSCFLFEANGAVYILYVINTFLYQTADFFIITVVFFLFDEC